MHTQSLSRVQPANFPGKYWSGLTFPTPGDLPDTGIEPVPPPSPELAGGFFTTEPPGKPLSYL